jgi:hypothetical protein
MKRWQWVLLILELALFAAILVLPQVDLPAFTFHGGTAPVAVKSRFSSAPARPLLATLVRIPLPDRILEAPLEISDPPAPPSGVSRLFLICTLIC